MKKDAWRLDLVGPRERRALTVGLIAVLVVVASGLVYLHPSGFSFPATIHVDRSTGLADSPLHLWITGLQPNQTVTFGRIDKWEAAPKAYQHRNEKVPARRRAARAAAPGPGLAGTLARRLASCAAAPGDTGT